MKFLGPVVIAAVVIILCFLMVAIKSKEAPVRPDGGIAKNNPIHANR